MFKLVNIESDSIKLFLERHSTSSGVEYLFHALLKSDKNDSNFSIGLYFSQ